MGNTNNKRCGFNYEPSGKVYPSDSKIIKHKDGTISVKPPKNTTRSGK